MFGSWHKLTGAVCAVFLIFGSISLFGGRLLPNPLFTSDSTGVLATYSTAGGIDINNAFFQSLGTNGRSCNTCHISSSAWTITPADVRQKFDRTQGTDPIFRTNDGSNCPSADVSTIAARRSAYSQLLNKALIRVSVPVPPNAEFQIIGIQDPYNCPETTSANPALYRRPLPAANLDFLSTVMWDGRETIFGDIPKRSINLVQSLTNQANDATVGHAQGAPPTAQQLADIVAFETSLFTESSSPTEVVAIVEERGTEQFVRMTCVVEATEPHNMSPVELNAIPTPAEFAPAQLSESELVAALQKKLQQDANAGQFSGAVLLAKNGKPIFERAYGIADRERSAFEEHDD